MDAEKIVGLQKKVKELANNYVYYDQFYYTPGFGAVLSSLTSLETNDEVEFRVLSFEVDQVNTGLVLSNFNSCVNESGMILDGSTQFNKIPDTRYSYVALVSKRMLPAIEAMRFKSKEHLELTLESLCVSYAKFDGIVTPDMFPYPSVQAFFYLLNEWRFETGRVTLDDEVIMDTFLRVGGSLDNREKSMVR